MSLALGIPLLECVYLLGCARWVWRRCLYTGALDSENWEPVELEDFEPVPRMCRYILAVYEDDLSNPLWAPPGGYRMKPENVLKRAFYTDTEGNAPPYLLYLDHDHSDIVLAVRGLNLGKESDYAVLLDNKLGKQMFDGGYVHNGLLKAAAWLLNQEAETLTSLLKEYPSYTLTLAGHSLGAGVASLATMVIASNRDRLGSISRKRFRCFALAPPRCMSLNLAVRHADIINSVILQVP